MKHVIAAMYRMEDIFFLVCVSQYFISPKYLMITPPSMTIMIVPCCLKLVGKKFLITFSRRRASWMGFFLFTKKCQSSRCVCVCIFISNKLLSLFKVKRTVVVFDMKALPVIFRATLGCP